MKPIAYILLALLFAGSLAVATTPGSAAPSAEIVVTTAEDTVADDGNCSLREAIEAANTNSSVGGCAAGSEDSGFEGDVIKFAIPGNGPHTIALQAALPPINSNVHINGLSQAGASCQSNIPSQATTQAAAAEITNLMIELDGSTAGDVSGLAIDDGGKSATVDGLIINRFARHAIHIFADEGFDTASIFCNWIGTDASGSGPAGNGRSGIYIRNSPYNRLASNVISANGEWGVLIEGTEAIDNTLEDNYIGTNSRGADLGNTLGGVLARNSGPQIIGGTYTAFDCCIGNSIAYNGGPGVGVDAKISVSLEKGIRGNRIYANDGLGIDLELDGVTPNDQGDGEGQRYLGAKPVETDEDGNTDFVATLTGPFAAGISPGDLVTSTASDPAGNTSEFGKCVKSSGPVLPTGIQIYLPLVSN